MSDHTPESQANALRAEIERLRVALDFMEKRALRKEQEIGRLRGPVAEDRERCIEARLERIERLLE